MTDHTRDDMTCARAEELFSDHLEGTLGEPLRGELDRHLSSCSACRALREELAFVGQALREFPEVEPSATLAARAAAAALRAGRAGARTEGVLPFLPRQKTAPVAPPQARPRVVLLPAWAQSLAAGLALVTIGTLLLTTRTEAPARAAAQIVGATVNTGAYLAERGDRLVEDVRVLRVVLETAFEGRVERVGERVEDVRKLLEERRRGATDAPEPRGEQPAPPNQTNDTRYTFPNPLARGAVSLS